MRIPRPLKICAIATAIVIALLITAILILYFTLLKPKQPKITTQEVTIENISVLIPLHLNVTLGLLLTVDNPNYASFKYENTTAYVTYRGFNAAEAPLGADTIPARGTHDIRTHVLVIGDNLVSNPGFLGDFLAGSLNFTSATTFHGKAKVLNLFKIKTTTYSTCNISVFIVFQNASSVCTTELRY